MKFSCNNCNTKYSLPDEKFAGKVITLTCKKCGAKIVVKPEKKLEGDIASKQVSVVKPDLKRETQVEDRAKAPPKKETGLKGVSVSEKKDEVVKSIAETIDKSKIVGDAVGPGWKAAEKKVEKVEGQRETEKIESIKKADEEIKGVEEGPTKSSEAEEKSGWYYSRGGEQKGPFSDGEIEELVENNVITPKTFVWRDGMMDWMRAGTCVEFRHFFEKGEESDASPSEKKVEKKNAIEALGLEEIERKFGKEKKEPARQEGSHPEVSEDRSVQEDFFNREASVVEGPQVPEGEDWTKLPSNEDADAPRENTRIVIMKAGLSESAKRKRMLTRIIMAAVLIGVFIFVFIRNLGPILSAVGVQIKSGVDLEMEDLDKETLSKMTPEERERYRKALLGIKETKKLTKEQKNRIAIAIRQKKDTDVASILENAKVEGGQVIYDNLGRDRLGPTGGGAVDLNLESKLANLGINTRIDGVNLSGKVERQDLDLSSKLPDSVDKPDEEVMMAVVNKNRGSLRYCYERHLKASSSLEGKAIFRITVQNNGSVSKVESLSSQISGTMFEECFLKEIKKWVFPKFKGEPVTFEVPFVLTTTN
jgi:DNA-directed RNA polymerase subunit RPC12/RpoP